jgi:tRNA(adenine34) deaminase
MLCLRSGAAAVGWQALRDATLYVTLEPCPMCAGAMLQSRVGTVVYGAPNTLLGADGSWVNLLRHGGDGAGGLRPHAFHPSMRVRRGVLAEESSVLMKNFFRQRRREGDARTLPDGMTQ